MCELAQEQTHTRKTSHVRRSTTAHITTNLQTVDFSFGSGFFHLHLSLDGGQLLLKLAAEEIVISDTHEFATPVKCHMSYLQSARLMVPYGIVFMKSQ